MSSLEDLFEEVRDMETENPAAMDKILGFMEERIEEADNFMELLVKKLEHATITWSRPWFQESCMTTVVLKESEEPHETKFLKGVLTMDECERVEKNWRRLRKEFDIPNKIELFARWKNRGKGQRNKPEEFARQFVSAYLARGLQRTVRQVYRHVLSYYCRPKKGQYTKDEIKVMDICFYHKRKEATLILTEVLSREPRGIYKRLNETLNGKPEKKRMHWTLSVATKFVKLLMKYTGESLIGLKDKAIGINTWRNLEGHFGTQGEYLRHFWYTTLHCQLFCKREITLRRIRKKIFKILRRSQYRVWKDIKWKDVVAELPDGLTHQFVYWITVRLFRYRRSYVTLPIEELVELGLLRNKHKKTNKRLRTLVLNDKRKLKEIRYNVKCG